MTFLSSVRLEKFCVKRKFKLIKGSLKYWFQQYPQNLKSRILDVKDRISSLNLKAEVSALKEDEVEELHCLSANLHFLARINSSMHY
jgi:hypothetical protein